MNYDVFNGDADGLCALHQMRLARPEAATLVTGVKRDIGLLARVDARAGDEILVLDIAVEKNAAALAAALGKGARVRWFDHHESGELPVHANFQANIDTSAEVCTSLLVDRHLGGAQRPDYRGVGRVVFTFPPLAAVGLTAEEARTRGLDVEVRAGDMAGWASSRRVGLAHTAYRLVVDRATGLILGGHILGHHAEEAINSLGLAMRHGIPAAELKAFPWAYPSSTYETRHML